MRRFIPHEGDVCADVKVVDEKEAGFQGCRGVAAPLGAMQSLIGCSIARTTDGLPSSFPST